jgi:hypothetical protein
VLCDEQPRNQRIRHSTINIALSKQTLLRNLPAIPDELNQWEQAQPSGRDVQANESHSNRNEEPSGLNALGRKILHRKVIFTGRITPQREEKTRRD